MKAEQGIQDLLQQLEAPVVQRDSWRAAMVGHLNVLITSDFHRLVQLLYRMDVPEKKLRSVLAGRRGTDAAEIIADLLIERQLQKIEARRSFRQSGESEEEKW
jgi:hypothetical protein